LKVLLKRLSWSVIALAVVAMIAYAFVPKPVDVDLGEVTRGPMLVTVDQDGKTRVKERYLVSAPLAGRMSRVRLKAGDAVEAAQTLIASIEPTPPALLDERAREEAEARVRAAGSALAQSEPEIERATARVAQAEIDVRRAREMGTGLAATDAEVEQRTLALSERQAELRMALAARDVARFQLEQARAALLRTSPAASTRAATTAGSAFDVFSPVSGQVLRVIQENEGPIAAGGGIVEVGDVGDIEAVIDVLSRDAVNVRPGAPVMLERWGGGEPLNGRVRRVEPSGFTKISALGVEEQRVNVIVDFIDPPAQRPSLGDGFRVDARIVVWSKPDVLRVPAGALFRTGDAWATFVAGDGRAILRELKLGRMNDEEAEVLEGLSPGERVIQHPSDKVSDGATIRVRSTE
jgi:HlyD family secretion protein